MCQHCCFQVLKKMDDYVEAQEMPGCPPDLRPACAITRAWSVELRAALHDGQLFDSEKVYPAMRVS